MNDLAALVVIASLAAGTICLVIALFMVFNDTKEAKAVKDAATEIAKKGGIAAKADDATFRQQAGSVSSSLEAVASLASSLKDLDRVAQLATLALGFFAIAGVAAGLDALGEGIAG